MQTVKDHGCKISMDGRRAWWDNIFVERLWRTVKYERVYLYAYDSVSEARSSIMQYLDWHIPIWLRTPVTGLTRRLLY